MRNINYIFIFAVMFMCSCGSGSSNDASNDISNNEIIGGNCSYEEFPGTCEHTRTENGDRYFTYTGTVNGKDVVLEDNLTTDEISGSFPCSLELIKTGTCTPCVMTSDSFNLGECGDAAWDLLQE